MGIAFKTRRRNGPPSPGIFFSTKAGERAQFVPYLLQKYVLFIALNFFIEFLEQTLILNGEWETLSHVSRIEHKPQSQKMMKQGSRPTANKKGGDVWLHGISPLKKISDRKSYGQTALLCDEVAAPPRLQ